MRRVLNLVFFLNILFLYNIPVPSAGAEAGLIRSLQEVLEKSKHILERVEERLGSGYSIHSELNDLKMLLEEVRAFRLLLQGRFRAMEEELRGIGEKALSRHRAMSEGVSQALLEYIALMEGLSLGPTPSLSRIEQLLSLLKTILPVKQKPILGTLPYKHLRYPAREPNEEPSIRPAYRGGDRVVRPEDLKSTPEASITYEIALLAQGLNWNPVSIYEWVKNNIETEWYWGSMKGAEETLRQRRGNDADQASLLISLLRASGYPARYVRGVIEFFPDLERARNLFGIDDPHGIAQYLQKAGIPFKAILSGGRITNLQMEHIWVETYVPYANYRGAILDEHGKLWLGLDTSLKVAGYTYNTPKEIPEGLSLSNLRDQYLSDHQSQTPLEYLKAYINSRLLTLSPTTVYEELLRTRTLIPEVMNILPASLQFRQPRITHEYHELPEELRHRVRIRATSTPNQELFNITLNASELSNQKIVLTYEPESREDQQIIHSYGGLGNTPAYLIRLRPVLTVNGERVAVGREGLPMGREYEFLLELISPSGEETITNIHITGNLSVIGVVSQNASLIINETSSQTSSPLVGEVGGEGEKNAEQLLYEEAIRYIDRWNRAEEELSSLLRLRLTRPIPTVVTLGGVIEVSYLFDTPHSMEWKGLYVDSDLRAVETVASGLSPEESQKLFMELSSLEGSVLENRLFEEDFGVESISTVKLFGLARITNPPTEILTIDRGNLYAVLPTLPFAENIRQDIENSVHQNLLIRIPKSEIVYEDWSGTGYLKENPETGESGYMLSGRIAGGMSVWGMDRWPEYYLDILQNPYSEPPNPDPSSARYIQKIASSDLQKGKVGEVLSQPLQVLVLDSNKKPVSHVEITFRVRAGGGRFKKNGLGTIRVPTDGKGMASVELILGEKTSTNPAYWKESGEKHSTQVGENIVEASLPSGVRTTRPFTAYGFPGDPVAIRQTHGDGRWGTILSFSGFVSIILEDRFGNPVSNRPITFAALDGYLNPNLPKCDHPNQDPREAYLMKVDDPCTERSPLWGECGNPDLQRRMVETTSDKGAAIQIILGGLSGGIYAIEATYTDPITNNKLQTTFYHYTYSFGNCSGREDPALELILEYLQPSDSYGNNINAGRVGAKVPVMARLYFLKEKETQKLLSFSCEGNPILCNKVIGTREYETITEFKSSKVTFGQQEGRPEGGGLYSGTHTLSPGINSIPIKGEALLQIRRTEVCPGCTTKTKELPQSRTLAYQVYGVEILIDPLPVILVDENGYAKQDYPISYTIHPPEYRAMSAYVSILKDGTSIAYLPSEIQGKGTVTLSRGFQFDVESLYEVEVVLNSGTGVEIRSDRKRLAVGGILIRNANGGLVEELRFGDGSDPEKTYHIELVSRVLTESCENLTGKIRTVHRDGNSVSVPVPEERRVEYYLPEYSLLFTLFEGKCLVALVDQANGTLPKEKFVISNLSKYGLWERLLELSEFGMNVDLEKISVLYGGIGNRISIEINNAGVELPIEPVGIILIGIDGLRQDVLYPTGKEDVKEEPSEKYYIKTYLPGVMQILEGFNQPEEKQRYIMLPKVTAIFPSITYASWASIFTGTLPHETGITGNEFFARDLASESFNPIPGMAGVHIPPGVVSLSTGAFQPGKGFCFKLPLVGGGCFEKDFEFVLSHVIPSEFSFMGSIPSKTLPEKIRNSAPLSSLRSKTVFEQMKEGNEEVWKKLKEHYSISPYPDNRCDQSRYECRTVAVYNQYAKGADWWVTPSPSLKEIYEGVKIFEGFTALMDQGPTIEAVSFIDSYFSRKNPEGKRKRFPAVFSIYYSGLDHYAHGKGMEGYSDYFKTTTDPQIRDFIKALKKHGEFDNKIFILVSDHGMTEMPTFGKITLYPGTEDEREVLPDTSCDLKVDKFNKREVQDSEKTNNNLHIWELAEVLKTVGEKIGLNYRVLAPVPIAKLFRDKGKQELPYGATSDIAKANVIAAFNGPMAHLYLRSKTGWGTSPTASELGHLALIFKRVFHEDGLNLDENLSSELERKVPRLLGSIEEILIRVNGIYQVLKGIDVGGNLITDELTSLSDHRYVNAIQRMEGLNHVQRSGDIILIMRGGTYDPVGQRYSSGLACKAWHGSLNPSDSYVPMIIAYPGGNTYEVRVLIANVQGCSVDQGCDGNWRTTDLVIEMIRKQWRE